MPFAYSIQQIRGTFAALALGVAFAAAPGIANAAPIVFAFDSPTGPLGTSQDYTSGGQTVTAFGFTGGVDGVGGSAANLFGKDEGAGEQGLGISGSLDDEITRGSGDYIVVHVGTGLTNLQLIMNSVTGGESFTVWAFDAGFTNFVNVGTFTDEGPVALPDREFFEVFAVGSDPSFNVLINSLQGDLKVPEPAALALFASGLLGLALLRRSRRRS